MRARHRHFNPRHAGADLVLDARYINQADDTAVSNWADRSANAHTIEQDSAANQPKFRTNAMNGNPVVRFDGNDFLNGGDICDLLDRGITMLCVAKFTSGATGAFCGKSRFASGSGRYSLFRQNNVMFSLFADTAGNQNATIADTSTAARINVMAINAGSTNTLFLDGAQQAQDATLAAASSYDTTDEFFVGAYQSSTGTTPAQLFLNGDIAQVVVNFTHNTPLRKRLEHAAAFSFKISCN